jgi:sterol desaturase/sphingolipid hydroxylase (fatty acid hydroxylase superfamily)
MGSARTTTTIDWTRPPDWQPKPHRGRTSRTSRRGRGLLIALTTATVFLAALAIRSNLVFGFVLLALLFVPMERIWSLHPQKVFRAGWKTDVVHFAVNNLLTTAGLVVAVVVAGGALHAAVPAAVRDGIAGQPLWLQAVEALLFAEVLQYWAHRASHTVPVLWRFHKVHHSIAELDWLAAARLHPVDQAFSRACVVVPLFALGFTRGTFGALLVVFTVQAIFIHANVRFTFGPLRSVLATPEFHHWHHSADPRAYNSNFAGELPVLDRIFGTLHLPARDGSEGSRWPDAYGIAEPVPTGYLRQLSWPFHRAPVSGTGPVGES